ncbi:hypothetical protein [Negativicoccus succinicivorans]|uniref:hypothetical protein n=1 Tax=Negativicoccus succinicivorans TaxID=620903 RepID=UPI0029044D8B|nr:hypothetical protein [Negativicoccus succinicivorans]MDU2417452.1 hypothetical protein [Negativicoccus succinicivorans]
MVDNKTYRVDLMRTLWQHTYRATIFDASDAYAATIRIILGIPLDRAEVPENAPEVKDYITVLVEDTVIKPQDIIAFEEQITRLIMEKSASEEFQPTHCLFFYPSPAETLLKEQEEQENGKPANDK